MCVCFKASIHFIWKAKLPSIPNTLCTQGADELFSSWPIIQKSNIIMLLGRKKHMFEKMPVFSSLFAINYIFDGLFIIRSRKSRITFLPNSKLAIDGGYNNFGIFIGICSATSRPRIARKEPLGIESSRIVLKKLIRGKVSI